MQADERRRVTETRFDRAGIDAQDALVRGQRCVELTTSSQLVGQSKTRVDMSRVRFDCGRVRFDRLLMFAGLLVHHAKRVMRAGKTRRQPHGLLELLERTAPVFQVEERRSQLVTR